MADEPLLLKTVICPSCERSVPLRMANPRLYTVASREPDRRVTAYRWINGLVTGIQPHYYRIWQCPECLLADFTEAIEAGPGDARREEIRDSFRDLSVEKHMVLTSLRDLVSGPELDRQGAIAIHLAAFLIADAAPKRTRSDAKIGWIAIRLAWLFREDGNAKVSSAPEASQSLDGLIEATERLDQLFSEVEEAVQEVQRRGLSRGVELGLAGTPTDNPYLAAATLMNLRIQALRSQAGSLQMALLQDQQGRMAPLRPKIPEGATSLEKALHALLPLWPDLPCDEGRALRAALEAFEASYQFEGHRVSDDQATAQVNLILEILLRLGDFESALDWTSSLSKQAYDQASELRSRIAAGQANHTLSNYDETVLNRKINAMALSQQKASERRREILGLMLGRDQERIEELLRQHADLPPDDQLKALGAAGIHPNLLPLIAQAVSSKAKDGGGWMKNLAPKRA